MSERTTVEEMQELLNLLPPEETKRSASQIAFVVPRLPEHMQTEAVNQFVDQMFERARCFRDTGKLPEQIKAEKDKEEARKMWPWLLVMFLAAIIAVMVLHSHGINTSCNDPDVVLGGCNDN